MNERQKRIYQAGSLLNNPVPNSKFVQVRTMIIISRAESWKFISKFAMFTKRNITFQSRNWMKRINTRNSSPQTSFQSSASTFSALNNAHNKCLKCMGHLYLFNWNHIISTRAKVNRICTHFSFMASFIMPKSISLKSSQQQKKIPETFVYT